MYSQQQFNDILSRKGSVAYETLAVMQVSQEELFLVVHVGNLTGTICSDSGKFWQIDG